MVLMKNYISKLFVFALVIGNSSHVLAQSTENLKAIDLGLPSGTKWANMNLGANSPSDYGGYFSWGETSTKDTYSLDTYKWYDSWTIKDSTYVDDDGFTVNIEGATYSGYTKYVSNKDDAYKEICDYKTILDIEDDAARAILGRNWQMPSYSQLHELKTNCTWTWASINGVNGYKVVGPNGNFIFLPAAGFKESNNRYHPGNEFRVGEWGSYLSNQAHSSWVQYARDLYFSSTKVNDDTGILSDFFNGHYNGCRYQGNSIRPVFVGQEEETPVCAVPRITYAEGKLIFTSDTEGVHFVSSITSNDCVTRTASEAIPLEGTYQISVYAAKQGYENSATANAILVWTSGKLDSESESAVRNVFSPQLPVLIIQETGKLVIEGAEMINSVELFSVGGVKLNSSYPKSNVATVDVSKYIGQCIVVKVGDKTVKLLIKK